MPALENEALSETALRRQCGAGPTTRGDTFWQVLSGMIVDGELRIVGRRSDFEEDVSVYDDEFVITKV